MAFYRCAPPDSGGGGGGSYSPDYVRFTVNGVSVSPIINTIYNCSSPTGTISFNGNINYQLNSSTLSEITTDVSYITDVTLGKNFKGRIITNSPLVNYSNFNVPVYFDPDCNPISVNYFFQNCSLFNIKVDFPNSCLSLDNTFYNCKAFNQRVNIPTNANTCRNMFYLCDLFNQPLVFHYNTNEFCSLFASCATFNQPIVFRTNKAINLNRTFYNAKNMYSDLIFTNLDRTSLMFSNRFLDTLNHGKRINIYTQNAALFTDSSLRIINSTVGALTWAATTNGYYNATYNIYLLNNVSDALNNFNNYYHNMYGEYPYV